MQKGFGSILILVGILVLAAVAVGAYYFGKSQTLKPQIQNPVAVSQTPQPISTPSASQDEISNWKTYTNDKYNFSFKYPKEASIVGDAENTQANKILGQVVSIAGSDLDLTVSFDLGEPKESKIKSDENISISDNSWIV